MIKLNTIIVFVVLLGISSIYLSYTLDAYWLGHTIIGITAFILTISVLIFGAMLRGRMRRIKGINLLKVHRRLAVLLGFLVLETFRYGLYITLWRYEFKISLPTTLHGTLGLVIVSMTALQLIPSVVVKGRKKLRIPHMILGYSLPPFVTFQVALGIRMAIRHITT